ncbi:glycoside hydrolase family 28 protein [Paenibacillus aurantius]|uniref:Glycoside hydrolase family 28 protein n=1 Tax=Paenibacillus aurantius TaxID=2918900 RepID=A0AA96LHS7_9BACL|nr:glycoside hydrolase family 28 protein [Paenibacillus aurantius]WNQ13233.1 glycoside hydrolase family 28 protein [Paenibacillus aurantius]
MNQPKTKELTWTMPEVHLPSIPGNTVRLTDYGAVGDGRTDNTEAFRRAIEDCVKAGGGRVVIPPGLWLTGPITLASRLELHAEEGAVVRFSRRYTDYPLISSTFEGGPSIRCQSPLNAESAEDVAITGKGVFDGGGEAWRPVKRWKMTEPQWNRLASSGGVVEESGEVWWPSEAARNGAAGVEQLLRKGKKEPEDFLPYRDYLRPNLLSFRKCKRILLDGPTFQNSAAWNLHPWASEHVTIRRVTVRNPWYAQNGDGLDLDSCRFALVEGCTFDVGDDAICLKSGKDEAGRALGLPTEYVTIRDCTVYHGHGGFVIGSEMSGGVRRVQISDCLFMGTDIGLRFKSARGRGGVVEDIHIERIRMTDIAGEAISFHLFYEGVEGSGTARDESHPVTEETPIFRNIQIRDVDCAGADKAFLVNGLAEMPLEGVSVRNYTATAREGVVCHQVNQLVLEDVTVFPTEGPLVKLHQSRNVEILRLGGAGGESDSRMLAVTGAASAHITCRDSRTAPTHRSVTSAPEVDSRTVVATDQ